MLPEQKQQVAGRVAPGIKRALSVIARQERRTKSQALEILLGESPRIKAELRKAKGQ